MGNWKIETGLSAHVNFGLLPEEVFFFPARRSAVVFDLFAAPIVIRVTETVIIEIFRIRRKGRKLVYNVLRQVMFMCI